MDASAVEVALAGIRPALEADGFDLRVGSISEGEVDVILEATPEACHDCLVPDELLLAIIAEAIGQGDAGAMLVKLTKVGFGNSV